MKAVTLKLAEELEQRLAATAKEQGVSKSELLRAALQVYLDTEGLSIPGSCLELAGELVGCAEGPTDLASNKEHLQGFGT